MDIIVPANIEISEVEADNAAPKSTEVNGNKTNSIEGVEINEAEMDEMWSFVGKKTEQEWLWWAIDHNTREPLAYCFGRETAFTPTL